MLSVATSIDAAAVGLSFAALNLPIIIPAIIIGIVCALFSAVGLFLGNRIGSFLGPWAERLGGAILIAIGIKILFENLF
jgi:putative Mn2+ efflux pump MntP